LTSVYSRIVDIVVISTDVQVVEVETLGEYKPPNTTRFHPHFFTVTNLTVVTNVDYFSFAPLAV
jgi:hypothetical protein